MSAHVGECRQSLRMHAGGVERVATGISVQLPEERELDRGAGATTVTMPCTIAGTTAGQIRIHRVIAVATRVGRDLLADLRQNRRGFVSAGCGREIDHVAGVGNRGTDLAICSGVLIRSRSVMRVAE